MDMPTDSSRQMQLQELVEKALRNGADAADAMLVDSSSVSVSWRGGKIESLEHSEAGDLGLRVLIGKQQAVVSTTDRRQESLAALVERAVAMARSAPADEYCGLASEEEIARNFADVLLSDDYCPDANYLVATAREAEEAALAIKGVTQCEGADASAGRSCIYLAASNGFYGNYCRTGYGISASVLAGEGTEMERDVDYASCVFRSDLPSAASIGVSAAGRAVKSLGARKMPTCKVPVVIDKREAGGFLGHFASAVSGAAVARGTSFLKDYLGKRVFSESVNIIDDPLMQKGLRSRIFDGEGISPKRRNIVENGILASWVTDLRSARQLKTTTTGHASRSPGGTPSPSPSNFYMEAGKLGVEELINDIKQGFFVTDLMGSGVNGVTGDYSRAAKGFWIENGEISFPVNEMTIAGNLKDFFMNMTAANDLEFKHGIDSPTLRLEGVTVAGL